MNPTVLKLIVIHVDKGQRYELASDFPSYFILILLLTIVVCGENLSFFSLAQFVSPT